MERVLAIPDTHFPFHDIDSLCLVYAMVEKLKPTVIVQLGDLYDMYSHSKFPRSQDVMSPKEEIAEGRQAAEAMWKNVRSAAGKSVRMIQLFGNHDVRPQKRIQEKYPEIASMVDLNHFWQFHNVETVFDDRCQFEIDGVVYTHGFKSKIGDHMKYLGKSVIRGHSHRAGLVFLNQWKKLLFEMETGYLADDKTEPLRYTPTQQFGWVKTLGWKDELGPRLIPLG